MNVGASTKVRRLGLGFVVAAAAGLVACSAAPAGDAPAREEAAGQVDEALVGAAKVTLAPPARWRRFPYELLVPPCALVAPPPHEAPAMYFHGYAVHTASGTCPPVSTPNGAWHGEDGETWLEGRWRWSARPVGALDPTEAFCIYGWEPAAGKPADPDLAVDGPALCAASSSPATDFARLYGSVRRPPVIGKQNGCDQCAP